MGMSSYALVITIKRNPPSVQLTLHYYTQHCGNDGVYAYTVAELEIRKWKKPFLGSLSSSIVVDVVIESPISRVLFNENKCEARNGRERGVSKSAVSPVTHRQTHTHTHATYT